LIRNKKTIVLFGRNCHATEKSECKEMLVIPVNRAVVSKRIVGKMEGRGGGDAPRVADPKKLCFDLTKMGLEIF
jgi:hypothetical protein